LVERADGIYALVTAPDSDDNRRYSPWIGRNAVGSFFAVQATQETDRAKDEW